MIERRVGAYTFRLEYHRPWDHPFPHRITVLRDGHVMGEKRFAHAGAASADFLEATRELARIVRRKRRQRILGIACQFLLGAGIAYLLGRPLLDLFFNI